MSIIDRAYHHVVAKPAEIEHRYGSNVHILADPFALTLLSRLAARGTVQPEVNRLVGELYRTLVATAVGAEFPRGPICVETRMIEKTVAGVWRGEAIEAATPTVVVAIARGGILPAQIAFDHLHHLLDAEKIRQDHLALARTVGGDGHVTGAELGSAKIGGSVDGSFLLIPDPMGATGNTLVRVLDLYDAEFGRAAKKIALHLIVTPEALRRLSERQPDAIVYALRLDRGLSPPDVLDEIPGARWGEERGLNEHDYIVPGAGGLGEVITNSWV